MSKETININTDINSDAIAGAIQNIADEIDNAFRWNPSTGQTGYTVADSLESIALTFDRWVALQEKQYEDSK